MTAYTIDLPGADDLFVKGSLLEHEYTISQNDQVFATVSKRWIAFTDTYGVDIAPGQDDVLVLASILAIDVAQDREKADEHQCSALWLKATAGQAERGPVPRESMVPISQNALTLIGYEAREEDVSMHAWKPLAERLATLPLLLAGPIVQRIASDAVTVWVALRDPRLVTLRVYARTGSGAVTERLTGTCQTVRFGDPLHVVAVIAKATAAEATLPGGALYYYDLFFAPTGDASEPVAPIAPHLDTPGVLNLHPLACSPLQRLVYEGHPLPAFVLPPQEIGQVRLFHGSCRRPTGEGSDMLAALVQLLEAEQITPSDDHPIYFAPGIRSTAKVLLSPSSMRSWAARQRWWSAPSRKSYPS